MSVLLIQGCSKSKNSTDSAVPALDLYSGFFFKIIKKAIRENEFDERIDILILSAEYGLIEERTEIQWYDRRMDTERATELALSVSESLQNRNIDKYDSIIINVGQDYEKALPELGPLTSANIYRIKGEGIGVKGHKLKQLIRGDLSAIESETGDKGQV